MRFKQTCCICEKNIIEGGSDIKANTDTQYRAFSKVAKNKGWKTLLIDEKRIEFICKDCHKKIMLELKKRTGE